MDNALVIATVNRWDTLVPLLRSLRTMDPLPSQLVLSGITDADIPDVAHEDFPFPVRPVTGARGLAAQRNFGVAHLVGHYDTVTFLDDDSMPRRDFFGAVEAHFTRFPDSWAVTGRLALEGQPRQPKLTEEQIATALEVSAVQDARDGVDDPVRTRQLYGCNMAFRREALERYPFDEALPLYSWLEDADIARRITADGHAVYRDPSIVSVHRRDASGGRTSHLRFGYSTVANWEYLRRKGSLSREDIPGLARMLAKNVVASVVGGEKAERRVRLRGNIMAAWDIARGRVTPGRIEEF